MCEPQNRDNGASDVWALTAYYIQIHYASLGSIRTVEIGSHKIQKNPKFYIKHAGICLIP